MIATLVFVSVLLTVFVFLLVSAAGAAIGKEAVGWVPHITRCIVRRATARLPVEHQSRWFEEWNAELAQLDDRPLSALWFACGVALSARSMKRELVPVPAPVATPKGDDRFVRRWWHELLNATSRIDSDLNVLSSWLDRHAPSRVARSLDVLIRDAVGLVCAPLLLIDVVRDTAVQVRTGRSVVSTAEWLSKIYSLCRAVIWLIAGLTTVLVLLSLFR